MTEEELVPFLLLFFFFKASESSHPLSLTHLFSSVSLTLRVRVCVLLCLFCCSYDSYLSGVMSSCTVILHYINC